MSRKQYECFRCRDNGFPGTSVYLAGKDEQGKTVYVEEDGTKHIHKSKSQIARSDENHAQGSSNLEDTVTEEKEQSYLAKVTDESIQRGIASLSIFRDIAIQVDGIGIDCNQTRVILEDLQKKVDRLLNLVFAQQQMNKDMKQ